MKQTKLYQFTIILLIVGMTLACGNKNTTGVDNITNSQPSNKTITEIVSTYLNDEEKSIKSKDWNKALISLLNLRDGFEQLKLQEATNRPDIIPQIDETLRLVDTLGDQVNNRKDVESLETLGKINTSFTRTAEALKPEPKIEALKPAE